MTLSLPLEGFLTDLLPAKSIPAQIRRRLSPYHFATVRETQVPEMKSDGWEVEKRLKRSVKMRREKSHDVAFADQVWATFAKLRFEYMSKNQTVPLKPKGTNGEPQLFDVLAADEETVLLVICKSSERARNYQFKTEIETLREQRPYLLRELKKNFPSHKVKFLLATNNIGISSQTADHLAAADIAHLNEDEVEYYHELANHLGHAAKYQLLGNLFAGVRIPNLDREVVAIEAQMGGHKYYSFSIEPERLLKIAYILHRNKANADLMPTYQRLIKKSRLKNVSAFVGSGGYFPNSLIISLDTGKKGLRFDPFPKHKGGTRAGILHLPQTFRAAYVIDGQHRLYGYADSHRASTELIPVIAFVDLNRRDQVRLFMQINENQQAVPKNLRNTLNADLLYDSPDRREQIKALKLQVAQRLGETKTSPLYGRVLVGESPKTATRCITIDAISRGLERSNFLGSFSKKDVQKAGSFYRGSNDATIGPLTEYLSSCFSYVKDRLYTQFELGSAEGGFVFINNGIESMIRVFSDIVDHLVATKGCDPQRMSTEQLLDASKQYLDPMVESLAALNPTQGREYRSLYGSGAGTKYWRRLQSAISASRPDFSPPGLAEFLESEEKQFNAEAREMIEQLEAHLKRDVRERLENAYGAEWYKKGVPPKVQKDAGHRAVDLNAERDRDKQVEAWDCLYLIHYRDIMTYSMDQWKQIFEKHYTRPGEENRRGSWKDRTSWIAKLNELRNDTAHNRAITAEGHDFLVLLTTWLIKGQSANDL